MDSYLQVQQNEARHRCHWSVVPLTLTLQYLPLSHKNDIPYLRENSLEKQLDGLTLIGAAFIVIPSAFYNGCLLEQASFYMIVRI